MYAFAGCMLLTTYVNFQDSVTFKMVGQSGDMDWFSVNSTSGEISLLRLLYMDPAKRTSYTVSGSRHLFTNAIPNLLEAFMKACCDI